MNIQNSICEFIKKLNTLSTIKDVVKEATSSLLKLTDTQACWICLINPQTNKIEHKRFEYSSRLEQKDDIKECVEKIYTVSSDLFGDNYDSEDILDYFRSMSGRNIITEPIIYKNILAGYVGLVSDDENFYEKFLTCIQIAAESISSKIEIINLYDDADKKEKYRVEFLASISHEFKTPLNSIIGFSDMLKIKLANTDSYKYIDNISKSSKFLLGLIQDVLDLSRSQTKPLELHYQVFNPKPVILDILFGFEEKLKEKNIDLSYTLMEAKINADMHRFQQLIYNLVSNAIKFNRQNGKIMIVTYINENNEFVFEIKDTGDGISKKDCTKVFDFFSQVNRSKLKRQQGSGVGLALCKKIATAHGGDICFKSRLNSGSTFWFTLPVG